MTTNRTLTAAFAAALLLAACGGSDDDDASRTAERHAERRQVVSDDGKATLTVPAGAASAPQRVVLTAAPQTPVPADAAIVAGSVFRLEGDGGALAAPASLKIETKTMFPARVSPRTDRKQRSGPRSSPRCPIPCRGTAATSTATASPATSTTWPLAAGETCLRGPGWSTCRRRSATSATCDIPVGSTVRCDIQNWRRRRSASRSTPSRRPFRSSRSTRRCSRRRWPPPGRTDCASPRATTTASSRSTSTWVASARAISSTRSCR